MLLDLIKAFNYIQRSRKSETIFFSFMRAQRALSYLPFKISIMDWTGKTSGGIILLALRARLFPLIPPHRVQRSLLHSG